MDVGLVCTVCEVVNLRCPTASPHLHPTRPLRSVKTRSCKHRPKTTSKGASSPIDWDDVVQREMREGSHWRLELCCRYRQGPVHRQKVSMTGLPDLLAPVSISAGLCCLKAFVCCIKIRFFSRRNDELCFLLLSQSLQPIHVMFTCMLIKENQSQPFKTWVQSANC